MTTITTNDYLLMLFPLVQHKEKMKEVLQELLVNEENKSKEVIKAKTTTWNDLPFDVQEHIYKLKYKLEMKDVFDECLIKQKEYYSRDYMRCINYKENDNDNVCLKACEKLHDYRSNMISRRVRDNIRDEYNFIKNGNTTTILLRVFYTPNKREQEYYEFIENINENFLDGRDIGKSHLKIIHQCNPNFSPKNSLKLLCAQNDINPKGLTKRELARRLMQL